MRFQQVDHLLVCCKPLNKVCRDLSRHHPAPPASPAPPSPPAPPGTPGTLLHRHPDMILTSLSCSFLFLHDPLSFRHSSFNSLLDLFPSGETCSQADRASLDDTPTVNRWEFHSHSLGGSLLRAGAKMSFSGLHIQMFDTFLHISSAGCYPPFGPLIKPVCSPLSPSNCELLCVHHVYFSHPDRLLWSSGIDVSGRSPRLVVTKSRSPGITSSQILENLTYERINFPRASDKSGAAAIQPERAPLWHCASAGPALFFAPHVDPRRHHTCTSPSAGSCVLVDIPFLVTFSTVITWTSQGASNMYALQPKAGARDQFTTSQR